MGCINSPRSQHTQRSFRGSGAPDEDVRKMAIYLGLDPVKDMEHSWIADEALDAPLPDGWAEHEDNHGPFFYHITSKRAYRQHPLDDYVGSVEHGSIATSYSYFSLANVRNLPVMVEHHGWLPICRALASHIHILYSLSPPRSSSSLYTTFGTSRCSSWRPGSRPLRARPGRLPRLSSMCCGSKRRKCAAWGACTRRSCSR